MPWNTTQQQKEQTLDTGTSWMDLQRLMLSEESQFQKVTYVWFPCNILKWDEEQFGGCQGVGRRGEKMSNTGAPCGVGTV